jgi:hypothetical protein
MWKRRKALVWTLVGLLFFLAILLVSTLSPPRANQPVYNGRTLERWLDVGAHSGNRRVWGPRNDGRGPTPEQLNEAAQAVRAIGTNAIPTLLQWISYKPSGPKRFTRGLLALLHMPPQASYILTGGYKPESRSDLAALGFALLSTNALPAHEELSKMVRDEKDGGRQSDLGEVLFSVTNTPSQ